MSNIYKYFLAIILFNSFFSLDIDDSELIKIPGNILKRINLIGNKSIILELNYTHNNINYISIISINDCNFILESEVSELNCNKTNKFKKEVNMTVNYSPVTINIKSEKNNTIDIINIIKDKKSSYFEIENEDQKYNVENYNFVKFLSEERNKVEIKFKDAKEGKYRYGIVELESEDINYIPKAFYFEARNESIEEEHKLEKEISIECKKIKIDEKKNIAFIFSIETEEDIGEYTVNFNKDIMNNFLIGCIILALIFAIITFFLIRRKQNITTKSIGGDDFYDEKNEEEEKEN